ncbi:MAG: hydroxymethylbilane synthase [Phycisphaerae bacterium]
MTCVRSADKNSCCAKRYLRLGARPSTLSLAQSRGVAQAIEALHPHVAVEIVAISTTGDQITDRPLHDFGGKGLFTKQLELALLEGRVDFAVHSYKDVPVTMPLVDPAGLVIAATPARVDSRDVLVSQVAKSIHQLRRGARVGTGSLRRKAQLLAIRPDLEIEMIRGNIDTRLAKYAEKFDAIVLAAAGLKRAKLFDGTCMTAISANVLIPAAGQGALALQCLAGAEDVRKILGVLSDAETDLAVGVEREVVRLLEGDCKSPIAAAATVNEGVLHLRVAVGRAEGLPPVLKADVRVGCDRAGEAAGLAVASLKSQGLAEVIGK